MSRLTNALNKIENKWSVVILTAYLCIVFSMQALALDAPFKVFVFLSVFVLSFLASVLIIVFANKWLNKLNPNSKVNKPWLWGIVSCILLIGVYMIYQAGQYPGGLSPDSLLQYEQALGAIEYNNWHPILHTLLFFTIPVKLGKRLGFIILCQIVYFALAFGYLVYVMAKNGCSKIVLILFDVYIIFNPYLASYIMWPWKDLAFMIFVVWMLACYIQIVCSKGLWLSKWYNVLSFALALILGNSMRHNAILFIIPLLIIAVAYVIKEKKTRIVLLSSVLVLFVIVKLFIGFMNLPQLDSRVVETIGLPVNIWCNIMKNDADLLSTETKERLLTVASLDDYENIYEIGDFNELKFSGKCDVDILDSFTYKEALTYMFECFKVAPEYSWRALARLTMMFWDYEGFYQPTGVWIAGYNFCGIEYSPKYPMYQWVDSFKSIAKNSVVATVTGSYGFMMLSLFVVASVLFANNRKSFIHIIPIFVYNGGTALLLSTYEDYRFFLFTIVIWIPLLFVMFKDRNVIGKTNE